MIKKVAAEIGIRDLVRTVCPGIRADDAPGAEDQSRSFTVKEALDAGVDMLVVGRAVMSSSDPRASAERILEQIQ